MRASLRRCSYYAEMEAIETERTQMVNQNRERLAWLDIYKKYHNVNEISRRMVVDLIDHIRIYENTGVGIVWRYQDDFSRMADVFDNLSDEVKNHLSEVQKGKEE